MTIKLTSDEWSVTSQAAALTISTKNTYDVKPYACGCVSSVQTRARDRREMLAALEAGELDILVGTHAVISADVRFRSLALAVVDEQHKCGLRSQCACSAQQADLTCIMSGAMWDDGAEILIGMRL